MISTYFSRFFGESRQRPSVKRLVKGIERKLRLPVTSYVEQSELLLILFPDKHLDENIDILDESVEGLHSKVIPVQSLGLEGYVQPCIQNHEVSGINEEGNKWHYSGPFIRFGVNNNIPMVGMEKDKGLYELNVFEAYRVFPLWGQAIKELMKCNDYGNLVSLKITLECQIDPLAQQLPYYDELPSIAQFDLNPEYFANSYTQIIKKYIAEHANMRSIGAVDRAVEQCAALGVKNMAIVMGSNHIADMQKLIAEKEVSYITVDPLRIIEQS